MLQSSRAWQCRIDLVIRRILLVVVVCVTAGAAVWAAIQYLAARRNRLQDANQVTSLASTNVDPWAEAVAKVKADRGEPAGWNAVVETPPELKHYSERHWFLATQVAEVAKHNVPTCQDYLDLAAMIQRGEMVAVPAVTSTYVLYGVGEKADERAFSRYEEDRSIELYNETQLSEAYRQLDEKRSNLQSEIASLKAQSVRLGKRERSKQSELRKQISAREQELNSTKNDKALLDEYYGHSDTRQRLLRDYEALQTLAKNFGGRSYDVNSSSDRHELKVNMLRSLRPPALKILEEVASAYHRQFGHPLPVSSLVRPEEYQRALRRVNRNAVLIETPPHSTGLAFDIDYRYMSAAEQAFVMVELARMKNEGRIEVIRERNANYHVFAFLNGMRPSDQLIAASLDEARGPLQQAHHAPKKAAKAKSRSRTVKARRPRANVRVNRQRRRR
jgi:hypothetical protein